MRGEYLKRRRFLMKLLIFLLMTSLTTFALEHSESSGSVSSCTNSPRSPRSPREELGIINNVDRIQKRDKQNRIIREFYSATLASGTLMTVEVTFDKKNIPTYLGFWRRGQKQPRTMTGECAQEYFDKLKRAFLQNNPTQS